ncbi:hypothetical protein [Streptomyces sp. TLI_105]|uniref:hypothetical protein n=1 Tax=Streptomyces sp. TLI_105 TaxID=1881019 RepID=UPI00115F91DC|nr:hypothetical protein [Streptomyces sp. TLI_105]
MVRPLGVRRLAPTLSGREARWWVPAATAAAGAPPVLAVALLSEAGLLVRLGGWLTVTAALAAPALVARRLLPPLMTVAHLGPVPAATISARRALAQA